MLEDNDLKDASTRTSDMGTSRGPFEPEFSELPQQIPLFPLSGALLLPGGRLPLNIFEPRYLSMMRDAMAQPHRLIGMIQSRDDNEEGSLYHVGCAGRISSYSETDDGRMLITLSGTSRFRLLSCENVEDGYHLARVTWTEFKADLTLTEAQIDRDQLIDVLRNYFKLKGYTVDWDHIQDCEDERLVSTLSMICPFEVSEKQALLESPDLAARAELLVAILEMASHSEHDEQGAKH